MLVFSDSSCLNDGTCSVDSTSIEESLTVTESGSLSTSKSEITSNPTSIPTGKLDKQLKQRFDATTIKFPKLFYRDRDGRELVLTFKELKKLAYCHLSDLGFYNPADRIPCPVQGDASKYQRLDCFAITDRSVRDTMIKILEISTTSDPSRYITLLMPMPFFDSQKALGYLDTATGTCVFFHADSRKIWSATRYTGDSVLDLLMNPAVLKNPDIDTYNTNY